MPDHTKSDIDATAPEVPETKGTGEGTTVAGPSRTEREFTVAERSQAQLVIRRFLQHRLAVGSLIVLLAVVLLAFVGGALWKYNVADITPDESQPPSWEHPFGTDAVGHDSFAQVLRGTQISLGVAVLVALIATFVGTIWGAVAGFYRGWLDTVLMRIADLVLTLPLLAVAAVLGDVAGGSWWLIAFIIGGLYWAYVSRVARGVVLSLREKEFIEASKALGASDLRIIFKHLVPNALGSVIVNATILVAIAILIETALSYLGFGVRPPDTSLGLLVSDNQTAVSTRPWLFYFPGLFIIIIALTINFIGDGLRDAFDPQQKKVRA
ncbi:peptide/nickel transport system permease protein [Prauserella shujinwangii]|uniref:Oligopeptide transport system permease protein OppC n=1 Tax=Prauserella shujinwangii TaxID=1453103 RepID=A0A2T0LY60_9PSEU|nr:ABC transporter permease [Prauserella shujinwangii]PRX49030.1 peptide/nickel transport system permease protein [Prauserella shujinwangii]